MHAVEKRIRVLGVERGLTSLRAICDAAKVDDHDLRRIMDGEQKPRRATIARLAGALGVAPAVVELLVEQARESRA